MKTVFHARWYSRPEEIKNNFRRKKLHATNQGLNFLGNSFNNNKTTRQWQCLVNKTM